MPNWITIARFPLLLVYVLVLYNGTAPIRLWAVLALFIFLMLDTVDGWVARRRGQATLIGSVLDIAADRAYELVLWVSFADLRLIPVAIPLIVIARTTLTDALRSPGVGQGQAPFEQHRSRLGRFLVGSRWMRTAYGTSKVVAFCGLALAQSLQAYPTQTAARGLSEGVLGISQAIAWVAVVLCLVRGMPVILGALRRQLQPDLFPRISDDR